MLWYEPYSSPAVWAEHNATDFSKLIDNWKNCAYNPGVLRAFLSRASYANFCKLVHMYRVNGAALNQFKDLMHIASESLKKFVDNHIKWGYNKVVDTNNVIDDEKYLHILLKYNFIEHSDIANTILANYSSADDELVYLVVGAITCLYSKQATDEQYVEFDYAENTIYEVCKAYFANKNLATADSTIRVGFANFVHHLCLTNDNDGHVDDHIIAFLDEICTCHECNENRAVVNAVCPRVDDDCVDDVYTTLKSSVCCKDKPSDFTIGYLVNRMVMDNGYYKNDLCKVAKLCINNLNHFNEGCISKSCEAALIRGIMDFTDYEFYDAFEDVNVDFELSSLENITINDFIATEAYRKDEEYDEEEEENPNRNKKKPPENDKVDDEGFDKKTPVKRDFDAEYRRYKNNVSAVDTSITKIISDVTKAFTGLSESRGVRKATKMDSVVQILARVFGTIAVFHVSKFFGLLMVIVRLANSRKVTERERVKLVSELQRELDIIDTKLNDGSIESNEARHDLQRTRHNLQDALDKIKRGRGEYMTDGAKQAVKDVVSRRG